MQNPHSSLSSPGHQGGKSGVTGAPSEPQYIDNISITGDERILFVDSLSSDLNCGMFFEKFGKYGKINVIKYCETENFKFWRLWVEFVSHKEALGAFKACCSDSLKCKLVLRVPMKIDVDAVYPEKINDDADDDKGIERSPLPARWHIVYTKEEFCNIFHFRKHLSLLVGPITNKEIKRFGKNCFLVFTKSHRQGHMLGKLKNTAIIKEVKPHFTFSYAKGVVFNQDVYDLSEKELLDICDNKVWKFFKVPKTKMTIFTFKTDEVPDYIYIDRERFRVRSFRERPLQCFKCFGFGHSSKVCARDQVCALCSLKKHEGECSSPVCCANCKGSHSSRYKECEVFKKELAAVEKAHAEHLSIGQAKRLLSARSQYSDIVKGGDSSKDQLKKPSRIPEAQLPPSQLEIQSATQPSSQKDPLPLHQGASQASVGASQADSLPDLGSPQSGTLTKDTHKAQVHDAEMEPPRSKRPLSPSSSPPKSSDRDKPPKRGKARSLEDLAQASSKSRPNILRTNSSSGKPNKKPPKNK